MTLAELLIYVGTDLLDDRTALVSGDPDSLWGDAFIIRQLNAAERIFARRAWTIIDIGNATAGLITLVENQTVYNLHKSVLRVYSAMPQDTDIPLGRGTYNSFTYANAEDHDYFDVNAPYTNTPGRPGAFATDAGTRKFLVNRPPDADADGLVLELKVARMPVTVLSAGSPGASPETPEEYHEALGDYAAAKCLMLPHSDADRKADGRRMMTEFHAIVKEARQDRQRAEMAPGGFAFSSTTAYV